MSLINKQLKENETLADSSLIYIPGDPQDASKSCLRYGGQYIVYFYLFIFGQTIF